MQNFEQSRLDKYIRQTYGKHIPQSVIEKAIRNKDILVNGTKPKASDKISETDNVFVHPAICKIFLKI